jgi:hypothetical protein
MRFQPGHSGNPAGRPPGSLNKKTIALDEAFAESAQEILADVITRAKNGEKSAMRMCMDRMLPPRRDRAVAIELPVIKTPEDAELALTVVTDELAAGNLTIAEASALVALIDRMLRLAERMWKFARARRYGAKHDAISFDEAEAPEGPAEAPQAGEKPAAPLYSPVNSGVAAGADAEVGPSAQDAGPMAPKASRADARAPLPRAA